MTWLHKICEIICLGFCTIVTPPSQAQDEGMEIAHIKEIGADGQLHTKHIALNKVREFYANRPENELSRQSEKDYSKGIVSFALSPTAVSVPFTVPVLDQGQYGTCVTFATTAALNQVLGGVDISQQCTLGLIQTLGSNLWNGAYYSSEIIVPLQQYGAVTNKACPYKYAQPNYPIAVSAYKKISSIDVSKVVYQYESTLSQLEVKQALQAGKVVTIGFGLQNSGDQISVQGFDIKVDGKVGAGGLWACQQKSSRSNYCGNIRAGHEVVIVGFDEGQQLFKIRNSWGVYVADAGDFYMTYSFFDKMVQDGTIISLQ